MMIRFTVGIWLMVALAAPAMASEDAREQPHTASCSPFLLEFECRAHLQTLAELHDAQARRAYLARHRALLEERRQSCICAAPHNEIGLLRE